MQQQPQAPLQLQQPQLLQMPQPQSPYNNTHHHHHQQPMQPPLPIPPHPLQQQHQEIDQLWEKISTVKYAKRLIATSEQDQTRNITKLHSDPRHYRTFDDLVSHIWVVVGTSEKKVGTPDAMVANMFRKTLTEFLEDRKKEPTAPVMPKPQGVQLQSQFGGPSLPSQIPQSSYSISYGYAATASTPQLTIPSNAEPQVKKKSMISYVFVCMPSTY